MSKSDIIVSAVAVVAYSLYIWAACEYAIWKDERVNGTKQ